MKRKFLLLCAIGMMAVSFASCGLGSNKTHEHTVEHAEAKAATCSEAGNIEHWYCTGCDDVWSDEALTQKISKDDTAIATLAHNVAHVEAVEPGCHYTGNVEYWHCSNCDVAWTDEEQTQVIDLTSVVLPATGSNLLVHMEAVEPGCHYNGNIEHWICYECEQVWQDEALTQLTNIKNVVLPATGSDLLVHMEAVEAGCHYNGNIEHWICYECEQVWQDEALTQLTNMMNVVIPATGSNLLVHMEAVEPACHYEGNIEYWVCYECEQVWADEALTQLTNIKNVVLPALGGEVVHVEAVEPTAEADGNIEYWYCEACQQVWQDEALTQLTNFKNVILPATGGEVEHTHNPVHFDAVEPACHYNGNIEYWVCYECEMVWQDEALTQLTNIKNVVLPATGGEVEHFAAVEPACHYNGNTEYWVCYECEQVWADEALTQITNIKNVVLPATGSDLLVHMEAVEPACHYEGNIEYWVCYECEQVWADEALTQITNIKNVVLPALGGEVVHVEAVEPTCTTMGNIEYWYCESCVQVWQDEALTQLTNMMNVKLGTSDHSYFYPCDPVCQVCYEITNPDATHTVVHAEAVAATCTAMGNIEYWYCSDCGTAWADAEQTQVTNMMSVKLPTIDHTGYDEDFVCDVCSTVVEPADGTTLTYTQANALGVATATSTYTTNKYYVSGTISSIDNTTYGNVYIVDESGAQFYVYGLYDTDGVRYDKLTYKPIPGDVITVYGVIGNYKGAPQMKNGTLTEVIPHECSWADATCLEPQTCALCGATQGEALGHIDEDADNACDNCGVDMAEAAATVIASKTIAELIVSEGWTSSTTKQEFALDDVVTIKVDGGNNSGKAYSGDHIRIYATDTPAGSLTITLAEGHELVSIKITTQTGTYAFLCVGSDTTDISNVSTEVSGSSVVLNSVKNGSNGKQVRITEIEVVYKVVE